MSIESKIRFRKQLTELGFRSYTEYLSSAHWADIRERYFNSKLFKGSCAGCKRIPLYYDLHHKTYRRLGNEHLMDLVALCSECHSVVHRIQGDQTLWKATTKVIHAGNRRERKAHRPLAGAGACRTTIG